MAFQIAGVLVTRRFPGYKDVPGVRYHYPKSAYQKTIERLVGALVLFYEPRRGGISSTSLSGGRSAFTGFGYISAISPDPESPDHGYAELRYSLDFNHIVPIKSTKISGQALQTAIIEVPFDEAQAIISRGLAIEIGGTPIADRHGLADVSDLDHLESRPLTEVISSRRVRDASFRYQIIEKVYEGRCALSGLKQTNGNGRAEVDAAHIRAVAADGPDTVRNGIALSKTLHWAFDRGLVSIGDDGSILSVERGLDPMIRGLLRPDGQAVLPSAADLRPHPSFLEWHRSTVFKGAA